MICTATGDHLHFHVSSGTLIEPDGYMVDMEALNGNGHCTCRDFQCRGEPNFVKNGHAIINFGLVGRTRCKHINEVILHLGQMLVDNARGRIG